MGSKLMSGSGWSRDCGDSAVSRGLGSFSEGGERGCVENKGRVLLIFDSEPPKLNTGVRLNSLGLNSPRTPRGVDVEIFGGFVALPKTKSPSFSPPLPPVAEGVSILDVSAQPPRETPDVPNNPPDRPRLNPPSLKPVKPPDVGT